MMNLDDKPDMWGTCPSSSMWGVPPDGDDYYEARRHPHFNEEVYWLEREVEFWRAMADSFWYSWYHGDDEIMETVGERATLYFEELDDE